MVRTRWWGEGRGTSAARKRSCRDRAGHSPPRTKLPQTAVGTATADAAIGAAAKDLAPGGVCMDKTETGRRARELGPDVADAAANKALSRLTLLSLLFSDTPAPPPRILLLAKGPLSVAHRRGSGASARRARQSHGARAQRGVVAAASSLAGRYIRSIELRRRRAAASGEGCGCIRHQLLS